MDQRPDITIVMPTFNSEKTIRLSLDSIRKQNYKHEMIEILVIDGGSTDNTIVIAKEFGCTVLNNPKVEQEYAKHIGILSSKGKYVLFIDSDEVLENSSAIENRLDLFLQNPEVKFILTGGYKKPPAYSVINDYINNFSDPFSFFMYGISNDSRYFHKNLSHRYRISRDTDQYIIFTLNKNDVLPLIDISAGQTLDIDFLKQIAGEKINDPIIIPRVFYLITQKTGNMAVMKNDSIIHYSADRFEVFFRKIRWKIMVNIHYRSMPGTGFSNREDFQPLYFRLKKYLFIPYALTFVLPLWESLFYAVKKGIPACLMHFPLTVYTAITILYQYFLKIIGIKPKLFSYGNEIKELKL